MPGTVAIEALDSAAIALRLDAVRARTLALVDGLDGETLRRQHVSILSPMVWDLGHIGNFEELWLSRELGGRELLHEDYQRMYNAVLNPRPTREALPLPVGDALFDYLTEVRTRTLETLERADSLDPTELTANGFLYEMVVEHEEQHQETMLQALQILEAGPYRPAERRELPPPGFVTRDMVLVPAGPFQMGASGPAFAYDNEKERHRLDLPDFLIDRTLVTHGDYLAFVEEDGYRRRELWSEQGWAWLGENPAAAPANWRRLESGWRVRFMDREIELPFAKPVVHVCFHEAEAYARFLGKRLPTEAEWEKAALWDPSDERQRRYPWGEEPPAPNLANLDQLAFEPADVGSYPAGVSPHGVHQMVGDVWEWTSSAFTPYPGFHTFPYAEYSEIFFGDEYRVLRGGSWATRPAVARGTFRNWDFPVRRQIFAGFRCAADAGGQ